MTAPPTPLFPVLGRFVASFLTGLLALLPLAADSRAEAVATSAGGGWNDWSCRPSPVHPQPVVLLHGLGGQATDNWLFHAPLLAARGYCVFSSTYGQGALGDLVGGLGSMRTSARQVDAFVDRVRSATGSAKVDLVGHSEGTTVAAYYLKYAGGRDEVQDYVGFGPNYRGTTLLGVTRLVKAAIPALPNTTAFVKDQCAACLEFLPPNRFLDDLARGGYAVPGVRYTNVVSRYDSVVTPYSSGRIDEPGVTNIVLQSVCPADLSGHLAMAADPNVNLLIRRALDPQDPPSLRCQPVLPLPL
ncbi:alpha/beta fold hydrolase [Arthrobacter sp. NEB 688]|uniref:alpha/beta fold hydrolase n=1 Tax=Arthrobacter sp. NEB 688 TaxID=904039 RepID=UPI0015678E9D|nr:alpha/beta fold hydrolase [Arthrobacter sp. NEB 688]QKE85098.1 alpha/beta fold hydrolase [Arthrobacter sp. NEB 688]